jgi:hypothetical protein
LIDELREHPERIGRAEFGPKLIEAVLDGRGHEYLPFCGQAAGLVHDIAPAAGILDRLVAEAETALATASGRSRLPSE